MQHTATLLAQYLQVLPKQLQHVDRMYCNIVGHNMLRAFGHPVVMHCGMLGLANQTSAHALVHAHALVQPCCINLARQVQHHATLTMLHEKFDHFQT